MTTLLIDDNPVALRILRAQLERLDIRDLVQATSGAEALALLTAQPGHFSLVFCDLQMPGMDGVEVLRHLADRAFRGAIVLMSAEDQRVLDSARALARARRLHVLGVLQKPIDPRMLQAVLVPEPGRGGAGHDPARASVHRGVAHGGGPAAVRQLLPTQGEPGDRQGRRGRGVGPVATPDARDGVP